MSNRLSSLEISSYGFMIRYSTISMPTLLQGFLRPFNKDLAKHIKTIIGSVLFPLQMIMLEGAKATTETVDALRTGAAAMKAMQKAT